ncbi:MAG TPA: YfiR family protein [Bryobacteraceae bacterium]|nr:YfiR family protein [Bryobacteraceae bacterium]
MGLASADRIKWSVRWAVVLACGVSLVHAADGDAVEEYRLKAAFISKFAGFVDWPPQVWKNAADPIVICVLGENPFGSALDQAISGRTAHDHKLAVRYAANPKQCAACQIVFISSSERNHFRSVLKGIPPSGVLTVSDADNFTDDGGMIDLPLESDRVRIVINIDAAEQAGLHISSKLLSLARIVRK